MRMFYGNFATTLSPKAGVFCFSVFMAARLFGGQPMTVYYFWGSVFSGVACWAVVYWLLYFLENWSNKETPNMPPTTTKKPVVQEPQKRNDAVGLKLVGDGNRTLVFRSGITHQHMVKMAELICVHGVDKLSQRKLHDAGVSDRFSNQHPTPGEIIAWLKTDNLIIPSGNEQYTVSALLFDSLLPYSPTPTNGANHTEYIFQDTTTPPPLT